MEPFALPASPHSHKAVFGPNSLTAGGNWHTWFKPIGKSHATIIVQGGGGGGGAGFIGAVSAAGGGGGGGGGAITVVDIPLAFLPPRLYISVAQAKTGAGIASYVSTQPNTTAQHTVAMAGGGGVGGNATALAGGAAGSSGTAGGTASMPLGMAFVRQASTGGSGQAGSLAASPTNVSISILNRSTGGTGGAGLPATGVVGGSGGSFTPGFSPPYIPNLSVGGTGGSTTTTPPQNGTHGFTYEQALAKTSIGGTGGGATHGSATGAGLVQAAGGEGGIASGGGGSGGALTGSTAALVSRGGPGQVTIYCY